MTYKPRRERRASGGKAAETEPLRPEHGNLYNAKDSPEGKHAEHDESDGFKRGGMAKKKRKEGGKVEGEEAKHHMGKRARGGHVKGKFAKGGAPFSAAHHISPPGNDKKTGPGEDTETIP
jgi:hypothetical protein